MFLYADIKEAEVLAVYYLVHTWLNFSIMVNFFNHKFVFLLLPKQEGLEPDMRTATGCNLYPFESSSRS